MAVHDAAHPSALAAGAGTPGAAPPPQAGSEREPIRPAQRLRLILLIPLAAALLVIGVVAIGLMRMHQRDMVTHAVQRTQSLIANLYRRAVDDHITMLGATAVALMQDDALAEALARRDRSALEQRARPLLAQLRYRFGVSRLYFLTPDGRVLLRAQHPLRKGDRPSGVTAHAVRAAAGGVELDGTGTLVVRLVSPWRDRAGRLLGYVELALDIDRITSQLANLVHGRLVVVMPKAMLVQAAGPAQVQQLRALPQWNRFRHLLLAKGDDGPLPPALETFLMRARLPADTTVVSIPRGGNPERALFVPITDTSGRRVADLVALVTVAAQQESAHEMIVIALVTTLVAGGGLFTFFYLVSGRLARRLEDNERKLREVAAHDGLTGLYNHETFRILLSVELERCRRYGHPSALLMLDIDHFKRVNDHYGHPAGDRVLVELSHRLCRTVRDADSVSRYGGEEFAIILPETSLEEALLTAERLRQAVSSRPIAVAGAETVTVTVSIGAAVTAARPSCPDVLIALADQALYAAKAAGRNRVSGGPMSVPPGVTPAAD
ncbi:MAG: diguanylate cyclase [Gammaproteobacteria bacterium]